MENLKGSGWSNGLNASMAGGIALLHGPVSKGVWWLALFMVAGASICFFGRAIISGYIWYKSHKK